MIECASTLFLQYTHEKEKDVARTHENIAIIRTAVRLSRLDQLITESTDLSTQLKSPIVLITIRSVVRNGPVAHSDRSLIVRNLVLAYSAAALAANGVTGRPVLPPYCLLLSVMSMADQEGLHCHVESPLFRPELSKT